MRWRLAALGLLIPALCLTLCLGFSLLPSPDLPAASAETAAAQPGTEMETEAQAAPGPAETSQPRPAPGYVLVQTDTAAGWLPLPESTEESYTYPIRQLNEAGELVENRLRLTPEGVCMEYATCENQDCVHQGEVTLQNKDTRVLMNFILCLPNRVSVALYTPEEVLAMYAAPQDGAAQ